MTSPGRHGWKVVTCCALCVLSLVLHLPTQDTTYSVEALRGKQSNHTKEIVTVSSNVTKPSSVQQHHASNGVSLDFLVAGFAKCGTTSLLKTFAAHNETAVAPKEECSLDLIEDDSLAYARIIKALTNASSVTENVKRGIKCPFTFTSNGSLQRLQTWFPNTLLIYGLRHPVDWFESYYNYRVLIVHAGKLKGPIPSAETLLGDNDWARVSTNAARFETILQKLVPSSTSTSPAFQVFLYAMEQMKNETENKVLREQMGVFLGLQTAIQPLTVVNVNKHVGDNGYKETIDICDAKYNKLRGILVKNGQKTQQWIRDEMLSHATVSVANREGFENMLKQWGTDPCKQRSNVRVECM